MAKLRRQLHEKIKGGHMETEDWWTLVLDMDDRRIYVEHQWSHANVWDARRSRSGTTESEINAFLAQDNGPAQRELIRLLEGVFPKE